MAVIIGGELMSKFKYTEKEYKELLSRLVILVDTREGKNSQIIEYFKPDLLYFPVKKPSRDIESGTVLTFSTNF